MKDNNGVMLSGKLLKGLTNTFVLTFFSCNTNNNNDAELDEYYVKYEAESTTIYSGGKLNATINMDNDELTTLVINQNQEWETIIGPVQKEFNAILKVESTSVTYDKLKLYTKISVSKNGSPFALKEIDGSDTPRDMVEISYTIDY